MKLPPRFSRQESQETTTGKRVSPDWNLGLGQPLLDLQVDQHHHLQHHLHDRFIKNVFWFFQKFKKN